MNKTTAIKKEVTYMQNRTLLRIGAVSLIAAALEGSTVTIAKPSELRIVAPTAFRRP